MNFVNFEIGDKTYKLRLNTRAIVLLEKQLGCNPVTIFMENGAERIPTVTEMVTILHAALQQYNHSIGLNEAYEIFDDYLAEGKATTDFIPVILEIYKASGIIPKDSKEETEIKND
jgi:hypothetical protein